MTVTTSTARVVHNGNGTTIEFAVPFRFLENSHVAVFLRNASGAQTQWTENTHYTLAGADEAGGGTLTVITTPTDYTPAIGEKLVALRAVPITQETDYVENDPFPAETHERALDKLTMVNQEQTERLDRTFTIPETDTQAGDFVLPGDMARANKFLAFDALGGPAVAVGTTPTNTPVSSFMDSLLSAADAGSARTQLDAQQDLLNLLTADGDLLTRAAGALARLAKQNDGDVMTLVSGLPAWVTPADLASIAVAPSELSNNVTNPNTQIDLAAKTFRAEDAAANIILPATTIDISTAGNGGRLDSDTLTANSTYHVLSGRNTSDGAMVAGFKKTYAKPAAWDFFRRHGSWKTDGSSNLTRINQNGDRFTLDVPVQDVSVANPGTGAVLRGLTSIPTGVKLRPILFASIVDTSTGASIFGLITDPETTPATPSASIHNLISGLGTASSLFVGNAVDVMTDPSAQVRTQLSFSDAGVTLRLNILGWIDRRGKDD